MRGKKKVRKTAIKESLKNYSINSKWRHPGGKLRDLGPEALSTEELIAIIISTGYKGKSAEEVANDLLIKFGSLESLSNVPLSKLLEIKGLGDVKIIRIAATFEISRRLINEVIKKYGKKENKD